MTALPIADRAPGALSDPAPMIRALLGAANKTKRDLGDHLGLSEPQMSKRMKGLIPWRHTELVAAADYFGVTVGNLFRDPMESLKTRSENAGRRLALASSRSVPDQRFKHKGSPLLVST